MKTLNKIRITVLFVTIITIFNTNAQNKVRVNAPDYNVEFANITLDDGISYKVVQEKIIKNPMKMTSDHYYQFFDTKLDKGEYSLIKLLRVRPINSLFFKENVLLEYFTNSRGRHIIIKQIIPNGTKLR